MHRNLVFCKARVGGKTVMDWLWRGNAKQHDGPE